VGGRERQTKVCVGGWSGERQMRGREGRIRRREEQWEGREEEGKRKNRGSKRKEEKRSIISLCTFNRI